MDITELRTQIDALDNQIISLLEQRLDVADGIARYKLANGLPVLDESREEVKLSAIGEKCRPETQALLLEVYDSILSTSRAWQTQTMEQYHGE